MIHHPSRELKAVQRFLLDHYVSRWPVHDAAMAYRSGFSPRVNAMRHRGARFTLRLDFKEFFPSITADDLSAYLAAETSASDGWSLEDIAFFVRIVCRNRRLTIGAPTSPALSNVICRVLDAQVFDLASQLECTFTRYADDVFLSCRRPGVLQSMQASLASIVAGLPYPKHLQLNASKTVHSSRKRRCIVTGIVLTSQGEISLGRKRKRRIRALIHGLDTLGSTERKALAGVVAHAKSVEPQFINRLTLKFGASRVQMAMRPDAAPTVPVVPAAAVPSLPWPSGKPTTRST